MTTSAATRSQHCKLNMERVIEELEGCRVELGLGPLRRRDVVCTGRLQSVVRPDGTRWEVTMYCQHEVLWTVLMGIIATAMDSTRVS